MLVIVMSSLFVMSKNHITIQLCLCCNIKMYHGMNALLMESVTIVRYRRVNSNPRETFADEG